MLCLCSQLEFGHRATLAEIMMFSESNRDDDHRAPCAFIKPVSMNNLSFNFESLVCDIVDYITRDAALHQECSLFVH